MKEKEQNSRSTYRILSLLLFVLLIFAVVLWVYEDRSNEMLEQKNILIERLTKTMKKNNSLEFENDSLNDLLLEQQDELFLLLDTLAELSPEEINQQPDILLKLDKNVAITKALEQTSDSLRQVNDKLRVERDRAIIELKREMSKTQNLLQVNAELERTLESGMNLTAAALRVKGQRKSWGDYKSTSKSSRVDQLESCFSLVKNKLANKGYKKIHLRFLNAEDAVLSPDGVFVKDTLDDRLFFTHFFDWNYIGESLDTCLIFPTNQITEGSFHLEVYIDGYKQESIQVKFD